MGEKLQAKIAGIVAAVAGFIVYMATLPPEQQDNITGPIVAVIPLTWRPEVGLIFKAVFSFAAFYGIYKASLPGHVTPPVLPPTPPTTPK